MDPEKMNLTEEDIKNRYISPAILKQQVGRKRLFDGILLYGWPDQCCRRCG